MIWPLTIFLTTSVTGFLVLGQASRFLLNNEKLATSVSLNKILRRRIKNKLLFKTKGFENPMTILEAYKILNVTPISSISKIRESHRQLMLRNHPDNGGSNYIASKVNEAKELICNEKRDYY
ncbi:chaperone DNAj domain chaperone [Cryptosporidium bovis]|uniref:chaperone DNAj domain chaperone n=1 Tax=Cryptosporidium bovis TaxID=310047 RepID=UPI00351AAB91|nr:chaperone DNAj domain chaperone [Cryptosporidium bovis]